MMLGKNRVKGGGAEALGGAVEEMETEVESWNGTFSGKHVIYEEF